MKKASGGHTDGGGGGGLKLKNRCVLSPSSAGRKGMRGKR